MKAHSEEATETRRHREREGGTSASPTEERDALRVTGKHVGLLINFNSRLLTQGVKRFVL